MNYTKSIPILKQEEGNFLLLQQSLARLALLSHFRVSQIKLGVKFYVLSYIFSDKERRLYKLSHDSTDTQVFHFLFMHLINSKFICKCIHQKLSFVQLRCVWCIFLVSIFSLSVRLAEGFFGGEGGGEIFHFSY